MDTDSPSSSAKRARRTTELSDDDIPLLARRKASRLSYKESDDEDETNNGDISRGSDALLDEVRAEEDPDTIRCICGDNDPEDERAFISCDGCQVWQHMSCVGLPGTEKDAPDRYLCEQCGPYGKIGAGFGGSQQPSLPIRNKRNRPQSGTPSKAPPSSKKTLSELTKSYYNGVPSAKKSKKRVSFSSDVKPASSSSEQDGYNPSEEAISENDDEEDYAADLSEEDSEDLFLPQSHRSRRSEEDDEDISLPQPHPSANTTKKPTAAKTPKPPNISDDIVKKWMEGGCATEFATSEADSDAGSDESEIEIPDMSEGKDLFAKLVELEKLIFTLKARLEKRGKRIKTLKGRVKELEEEKSNGLNVDSGVALKGS